MALRQTQLTTGATAQKLVQAEGRRRGLVITNHDATNAVVLGSSTVTATGAAGGIQVKAGASRDFIEGPFPQEEWWVVAAAGTPIVGVVESLL